MSNLITSGLINLSEVVLKFIFMGRIGFTELLPIIFIVLLLFGGKKIPEFMKGLGNGIKEFKNASKDTEIKTSPEEKN